MLKPENSFGHRNSSADCALAVLLSSEYCSREVRLGGIGNRNVHISISGYISGRGTLSQQGIAEALIHCANFILPSKQPITLTTTAARLKNQPASVTVVATYAPTTVRQQCEGQVLQQPSNINKRHPQKGLIIPGDWHARTGA